MQEQETNWGHEQEQEMPAKELAEFDALVDRSFELEAEIKDYENKTLKPMKAELVKLNQRILATLKHHNKDSYSSRAGRVTKAEKFLVSFPKNPDDKLKLIASMGQETYYEMSGINYNTFNSWYKGKMEAAVEAGEADFRVPGVAEPKYSEYLMRRRG